MHFKILDKQKKNPAKFFETGPEPEPDIEAGYPAETGFSRKSGRFLAAILNIYMLFFIAMLDSPISTLRYWGLRWPGL